MEVTCSTCVDACIASEGPQPHAVMEVTCSTCAGACIASEGPQAHTEVCRSPVIHVQVHAEVTEWPEQMFKMLFGFSSNGIFTISHWLLR